MIIDRVIEPGKYRMYYKHLGTVWTEEVIVVRHGFGFRMYFSTGGWSGVSNYYGKAKWEKISDEETS